MSQTCTATHHSVVGRLSARQIEIKYDAAGGIQLCPQPAPMCIDDRSADRQPHPYAAGFRGVEGLEDALQMDGIDARSGVAHCNEDALGVLLGADRELSCLGLARA